MTTSKFKRLKLQPWKYEEGTLAHANCVRDSRRLWSWSNTPQKGSEQEDGKAGRKEPRPRADVHPSHFLGTVLSAPTTALKSFITGHLVHGLRAGTLSALPTAKQSQSLWVWAVTSPGAWGPRRRGVNRHLPISSSSSRNVPSWGWPVRPGHRTCSRHGLPSPAPHQFHLPNSDT